jgi:hypothetical protein
MDKRQWSKSYAANKKKVWCATFTTRLFRACVIALMGLPHPPIETEVVNMVSITNYGNNPDAPELFQIYHLRDGTYMYRHLAIGTHKVLEEIANVDPLSLKLEGKTIELLHGEESVDLASLTW